MEQTYICSCGWAWTWDTNTSYDVSEAIWRIGQHENGHCDNVSPELAPWRDVMRENPSKLEQAIQTLGRLTTPMPEGAELGAVVEAELIIMEAYAHRHGCGCSRHLPWKVTGEPVGDLT